MTLTDLPVLEEGDLRLRAPREEDIEGRLALGNSPEIQHMFGVDPRTCQPLTRAGAEAWVRSRVASPHLWFIDFRDRLVGDAFFHSVNRDDRRASLALGILDPGLLGQGLGSRALRLLIAHGFDAMQLHRIAIRVLDYNHRAIAAYRKAGFVLEGRERQSARVGDSWHDDLIMGLLAPEWRAEG